MGIYKNEESESILNASNLKNGEKLSVSIRKYPVIIVRTLTGEVYEMKLRDLDQTVLKLKVNVHNVVGCSVDRQRLIFAGKVLDDDVKLNHYGIRDKYTLHMVELR